MTADARDPRAVAGARVRFVDGERVFIVDEVGKRGLRVNGMGEWWPVDEFVTADTPAPGTLPVVLLHPDARATGAETQSTIYDWMQSTFPGADPESPRKAIRALEEMVELCLACGAKYRDIQIAVAKVLEKEGATMSLLGGLMDVAGGTSQPDKIPAEAADVLIVLYGVAGMRGFDLHAEVDRKMAVNRARQWKVNGDGTGYHVKPLTGSSDRPAPGGGEGVRGG